MDNIDQTYGEDPEKDDAYRQWLLNAARENNTVVFDKIFEFMISYDFSTEFTDDIAREIRTTYPTFKSIHL